MSKLIAHNMIDSIITSETRIKLLLKFFLNPETKGYLRQIANDFGESTNGIRLELNKLSEADILSSSFEGRTKIYKANTKHPLFEEIRSIVLKSTGIDKVISDIIDKLGNVELAFIRGDYAKGKDSGLIELVVVGGNVVLSELDRVKIKTENLINRKLSTLVLNQLEYSKLENKFKKEPIFILLKN